MHTLFFVTAMLCFSCEVSAQNGNASRAEKAETSRLRQEAYDSRLAHLERLAKDARVAGQLYLELMGDGAGIYQDIAVRKCKHAIAYAEIARRDVADAKDPASPGRESELQKMQSGLEDYLQLLQPDSSRSGQPAVK